MNSFRCGCTPLSCATQFFFNKAFNAWQSIELLNLHPSRSHFSFLVVLCMGRCRALSPCLVRCLPPSFFHFPPPKRVSPEISDASHARENRLGSLGNGTSGDGPMSFFQSPWKTQLLISLAQNFFFFRKVYYRPSPSHDDIRASGVAPTFPTCQQEAET